MRQVGGMGCVEGLSVMPPIPSVADLFNDIPALLVLGRIRQTWVLVYRRPGAAASRHAFFIRGSSRFGHSRPLAD